jgi:hypothetical protein
MEAMSVKLHNPAGVPMLLTEKLLEYLAGRGKVLAKFAFGDWLAKLSDSELQHLLDLAGIYFESEAGDPRTDDVGGVALIGSEAEKNRGLVWSQKTVHSVWESVTPCSPEEFHELMGMVFWAVSLEGYRRQNFMEIKGKIRIHPFPSDRAVVTEKGIAYGVSIKNSLH